MRNQIISSIWTLILFVCVCLPQNSQATTFEKDDFSARTSAETQEVYETLVNWSNTWSSQNADAFLSFYAENYLVPSGHTRQSWEQFQRLRITTPKFIKVLIHIVDMEVFDGPVVRVHFTQMYRSNASRDQKNKIMFFKKIDNNWYIIYEEDIMEDFLPVVSKNPSPSVETPITTPSAPASPAIAALEPTHKTAKAVSNMPPMSRTNLDSAIKVVVRKHRRSIMHFYEQKLKFNPNLQGLIKIRLTIQKDGQVGPVEITHDSVATPSLTKFIKNQVKQWQFGRLSRNETVDLIFPFVPA